MTDSVFRKHDYQNLVNTQKLYPETMDLANTLRKKGYKHGFNCFLAKTHFYRY